MNTDKCRDSALVYVSPVSIVRDAYDKEEVKTNVCYLEYSTV